MKHHSHFALFSASKEEHMKKNVGHIDKILRIVIGILLLAAGYQYECWLGLIGIVPILTALFNTCPLYLPFGISTRKKK